MQGCQVEQLRDDCTRPAACREDGPARECGGKRASGGRRNAAGRTRRAQVGPVPLARAEAQRRASTGPWFVTRGAAARANSPVRLPQPAPGAIRPVQHESLVDRPGEARERITARRDDVGVGPVGDACRKA